MKKTKLNKRRREEDTFNTLLGAIELGELICKYLFTEHTIHPTHQKPMP